MRILIACICGLLSGSVLAAEWSLQPAVSWRMDHNTNRRLTPEGDPNEGVWLAFDADFKRATDTSELSVRPQVSLQRFPDVSRLDSDDAGLRFAGVWQGEYAQLNVAAAVERANTLTTELDETGIIDAQLQRRERSASLAWNRRLTPRWRLDAQLGIEDIEYPGGERVGLVGYRYPSASFGANLRLAQAVSLNGAVFGGRLTAPLTQVESRNSGLRAGVQWELSAYTQGAASIGLSDTRIDSPFGSRRDRGQVYSAQITRLFRAHRLSFSMQHELAASGRGVLSQRDAATLSVAHDFSSLLAGSLALRGVRNEDLLPGLRDDRYRYLSIEGNLNRRLNPFWILTLDTGTRRVRRDLADTTARGWYGMLGIRWTPAPRTVSR